MCAHDRKCLCSQFGSSHGNCLNHLNTTNSPPVCISVQRLVYFETGCILRTIYKYVKYAYIWMLHFSRHFTPVFWTIINDSKCYIIDRCCIDVMGVCGTLMPQVCIRDSWETNLGLLESNCQPQSNDHCFSCKSDWCGEFSQQSLCLGAWQNTSNNRAHFFCPLQKITGL